MDTPEVGFVLCGDMKPPGHVSGLASDAFDLDRNRMLAAREAPNLLKRHKLQVGLRDRCSCHCSLLPPPRPFIGNHSANRPRAEMFLGRLKAARAVSSLKTCRNANVAEDGFSYARYRGHVLCRWGAPTQRSLDKSAFLTVFIRSCSYTDWRRRRSQRQAMWRRCSEEDCEFDECRSVSACSGSAQSSGRGLADCADTKTAKQVIANISRAPASGQQPRSHNKRG